MSDIILTKSDGTTDLTFTPQSSTGSKKVYIVSASGLTEPWILEVSHNLRPVGAKGTDIHTVSVKRGDVDDTDGESTLGIATLELRIPRKAAFTDTVVKDIYRVLCSYLKDANIVLLKSGATPEGDYNVTGPFNPA
jgi:hypothetical protein